MASHVLLESVLNEVAYFDTINTAKNLVVTGATVTLPAGTTIGGSSVSALGVITSASANALAVGLNGATNPAFNVDSSTGSQAAGLNVKGATAAGNVAVAVISSGAAANLLVDALGTGTIGIGTVSTGAVTITPATTITGLATLTAGIAAKVIFAGTEDIPAGGTSTALALTKSQHTIACDAGGDTFTLADGINGQVMTILCKAVNGGSCTITPATAAGYTNVLFNAIGDSVVLQFATTSGWFIIGGNSYTTS